MLKNKQVVGGVVLAGFLAVATLIAPTIGLSSFVSTASAGYGGSGGSSKVTVCHKGKTIKVAPSAVKAHLAHGDTRGACVPAPAVLGASTVASTTEVKQEKIKSLQTQLLTLLQQLMALLKTQN